MQRERKIYSSCEMCTTRCPIIVTVKGGKVTRIQGNPLSPVTQGAICGRGNAGSGLLYDPDRLKTPLIRVGPRGEGKWHQATWEEAYMFIAEKILKLREKYGPETLWTTSHGSPNDVFLQQLTKAWGTPNYASHDSVCRLAMNLAKKYTVGTTDVEANLGEAKYIISLGRNFFDAPDVGMARALQSALDQGARLVYADPRFTTTAAKASLYLPIRPGGDLAFLLAMMSVIVKERLYDQDFVTKFTNGFNSLAELLTPFSPQWAEQETDIPAEIIIRVAREFAGAAPRAIVYPGWRASFTFNEFYARRARLFLNALVGAIEKPGGLFFNPSLKNYGYAGLGGFPSLSYPECSKERADGAGVPGFYQVADGKSGLAHRLVDILNTEYPYPIKACLAYRFDPIASLPGVQQTIKALQNLELLVVIDVVPSDIAWYADVVLPECTYLERDDPLFLYKQLVEPKPIVAIRQKAVEPMYSSRPGWQIFKELARHLGLEDYFPYQDIAEFQAMQAKPLGNVLGEIKEKGFWRPSQRTRYLLEDGKELKFPTPSKKFEFHSNKLADAGLSPIIKYQPPTKCPPGKYRLLVGRNAMNTNVATQNNPWLAQRHPINQLWINEDEARHKGINNGDLIRVKSSEGVQQGRAQITKGIRPDCVFMLHGFGHLSAGLTRAYQKGMNDNWLIAVRTDPDFGFTALHETFVEVEKL